MEHYQQVTRNVSWVGVRHPDLEIFDARGRRVFSRIGELAEDELAAEIAAALGDARGAAPSAPNPSPASTSPTKSS